jgi:hypothetical protein
MGINIFSSPDSQAWPSRHVLVNLSHRLLWRSVEYLYNLLNKKYNIVILSMLTLYLGQYISLPFAYLNPQFWQPSHSYGSGRIKIGNNFVRVAER